MRIRFYLVSLLIFISALGIHVATTAAATDTDQETSAIADNIESLLTEEGLGTNLAAENLPTTNPFGFWLETMRHNVASVFTFNAERKTAQFEMRLHSLDRKMAACAETGDLECVSKIETRIAALEERTTKYISKQEELRDQHQVRFEEWRAKRTELVKQRRMRAKELQPQEPALKQERLQRRKAAQQTRQSTVEERQQIRREGFEEQQQFRSSLQEDRLDAGE